MNLRTTPAQTARGCWRADCPSCDARGLLLKRDADPDQPAYCSRCGHFALIAWPEDREEIERLLALRPDPETRCWLTGETIADLRADNIAHGVPV